MEPPESKQGGFRFHPERMCVIPLPIILRPQGRYIALLPLINLVLFSPAEALGRWGFLKTNPTTAIALIPLRLCENYALHSGALSLVETIFFTLLHPDHISSDVG